MNDVHRSGTFPSESSPSEPPPPGQIPPGEGGKDIAADPARLVYLGRTLKAWEAAELLRGPRGSEVALTLGTGRRVRLIRECEEEAVATEDKNRLPAAASVPDFERIHRRLRGLTNRSAARVAACSSAATESAGFKSCSQQKNLIFCTRACHVMDSCWQRRWFGCLVWRFLEHDGNMNS